MSYEKVKTDPSSDKLDKNGQWNRFYPDLWENFLDSYGVKYEDGDGGAIQFLDIVGENYWKNSEDTAVFLFNLRWHKHFHVEPFSLIDAVRKLGPDEFSYIRVGKYKYIIRMWWD